MKSFLLKHKIIVIICSILVLGLICYSVFVFSPNKFIRKWRDIYIETAMSTMSHQWLATAFIPSGIIDSVMAEAEKALEENMVFESPLPEQVPDKPVFAPQEGDEKGDSALQAKEEFSKLYFEIDAETLPDDLNYGEIQISDISDLGIKTTNGDAVWAIDEINGLIIVEVKGNDYVGKLAIVKDSSQVVLAANTRTGRGSTVTELCSQYNAVLGINASAFGDEEGTSKGDVYMGYIKGQGEVVNPEILESPFQFVGFDEDDYLRVGYGLDETKLRDACQFYPILVSKGENMCNGTVGMGLHPRSVIAQTSDKRTLLLIIDGRRIGYSVGATMMDCAELLIGYDAYTAMNLDGGSSSSMTYMGEMITRTSSPMTEGRYLPDAWVVLSNE